MFFPLPHIILIQVQTTLSPILRCAAVHLCPSSTSWICVAWKAGSQTVCHTESSRGKTWKCLPLTTAHIHSTWPPSPKQGLVQWVCHSSGRPILSLLAPNSVARKLPVCAQTSTHFCLTHPTPKLFQVFACFLCSFLSSALDAKEKEPCFIQYCDLRFWSSSSPHVFGQQIIQILPSKEINL